MLDPLSDAAFIDLSSRDAVSAEERMLRVRFFKDEVRDAKASDEAGRPMYRTVEMVEIKTPGDRDNVVVRIASQEDQDRFPGAYARFKKGDTVQVIGTPLRHWGLMEPAVARSYEDVGIATVEQLAGMSDATCQQYRGSVADRQRARDYLEMTKNMAPVAKARAESEALRAEVEALKEQIAALGGKVFASPPKPESEAPKKRLGRPKGSKNKPKAEAVPPPEAPDA